MEDFERVGIGFGKRVKKTKTNQYGWEAVELKNFNPFKPFVLCLGGNGTTCDRFANSVAKKVERFLGVKAEDEYVDIYSLRYGLTEGEHIGDISNSEIYNITDYIFLPLVVDENRQRISFEQAQKNIRNVNVVTHCFGQTVLNFVLCDLANEMSMKLGYAEDEVVQILDQILNVSYAPKRMVSRLSTNVAFRSMRDSLSAKKYKEEYEKLTKNNRKLEKIQIFMENENTVAVYGDSFISQDSDIDEHHFDIVNRDENWRDKGVFVEDSSEIETGNLQKEGDLMFLRTELLDQTSTCIANILVVGVENSRRNFEDENFEKLMTAEEIAKYIVVPNFEKNVTYTEMQKE